MDRIRSTPGVESAAMASFVAFGNNSYTRRGSRSGGPLTTGARGIETQFYTVGAGYFRTLGLPMLRGREFTAAEELDPSSSPVVVIDEPLATALFPGQDPLGQSIQAVTDDAASGPRPMLIVGVAPGLRHRLSARGPGPHIY